MNNDNSLSSWPALNAALKKASEEQCRELLKAETSGRKRLVYLLRIHSRYNRLRAERERREIARI